MKWIIDRIEGDTAVCETENGGFADIKLESLPTGAKEGDVLILCIDKAKTEKRKEDLNRKMNSLFKD